jgi:hypothetical protein
VSFISQQNYTTQHHWLQVLGQLNFPRKLYHTTPLTQSTRSTLSLEIPHSSGMKVHKGLKIFIYKTKTNAHTTTHLYSLSLLPHISSCLCHPQRIQTSNFKLARILQTTTIIFIICSIQQPYSKHWVADIHKHIMSTPYKSIIYHTDFTSHVKYTKS